jgi:hypothetical protein
MKEETRNEDKYDRKKKTEERKVEVIPVKVGNPKK